MLLQYLAIAGVVVHDERAQAGEIQPLQSSQGRGRFGGRQAHLEPKCRAAAGGAVDADFAAQQGGAWRADGQSQTGAAIFSRREGVRLAEGIEYAALDFLGYPDSRVDDLESQQAILAGCPHPHDNLAGVRELDGVADEIDEDLAQPHRIAPHGAGYVEIDGTGQLQPLRMGSAGEDLAGFFDGFAQAEFDALELEFSGFDLREIQDVVDDLQQRFGRMRNGFREVALPRRELGRLQQFRHAHDSIHRRTDLVAQTRQELALGTARALRRFLGAIGLRDRELEFEIGVAQIDRALLDLLLEELAVLLQARVAMADLRQHLIEAVDERTNLIFGISLDSQAVVLFQRHPLHGLRQVHDGSRDLLLQTRGEPVRGQDGGENRRERYQEVGRPIRID